ncbi:hypothetical protein PY247_11665 [Acinetobacter proteolyticus]|nr:hypothetical protein [Acinetobacter proteolyticus]WEI17203.1 hypothetical protein PY247_11665 [Acinetobacter proteolyticus]
MSIFATGCKGVLGSEKINAQGAVLDLEIHQDVIDAYYKDELTDNGTVLVFEASNTNLIKISTFDNNQQMSSVEEPLSRFINSGRVKVNLGSETRYVYKNKKAITVLCYGNVLNKNESITVSAKCGKIKKEVGIIYLSRNDRIITKGLVIVDVKVNGEILKRPKNYEMDLKYKVFNQCLMVVQVLKTDLFDLDTLSITDTEVENFVKKWWTTDISIAGDPQKPKKYLEVCSTVADQEAQNIRRRKTIKLDEDLSQEFQRELIDLYDRKRNVEDKLLSVYSEVEQKNYIFFAPICASQNPKNENVYDPVLKKEVSKIVWMNVLGSASYKPNSKFLTQNNKTKKNKDSKEDENELKWANTVVVFKDAMETEEGFLKTFSHELCHTFGLLHTFNEHRLVLRYQQGYTDNIMDYSFTDDGEASRFNGKQLIFRKDQVDQMRIINNKEEIFGIHVKK